MKRIDILVLRELLGPWFFGVSMFTMLLVAATYLGRIARYLVDGVGIDTVIHITLLFLPGLLVQTFAMALLLGALLAFGRLSGDSEITAIRAAGTSLYRIVAPVAVFSFIVAVVSFYANEQIVPRAARESVQIMNKIAEQGQLNSSQPVSFPYVKGGRLVAMVGAVNFDLQTSTLRGVHIVAYDKDEHESWIMFANELYFSGDLKGGNLTGWEIRGKSSILSADGSQLITLSRAWPDQIPKLTATPQDLLAGVNNDMSIYSMSEVQEVIRKGLESGTLTAKMVRNYQYGYWNKIALPFAALIFGVLGATLGIRGHRTGTATGFAVAVVIIFAYYMLSNFMNVFSQGGVIPAYVASFTPLVIGLVASGVIVWQRNR